MNDKKNAPHGAFFLSCELPSPVRTEFFERAVIGRLAAFCEKATRDLAASVVIGDALTALAVPGAGVGAGAFPRVLAVVHLS